MVHLRQEGERFCLEIAPNRSLDWSLNLWFLGAACLWLWAIAWGFALLGAWPVLPFFGLEIACLAAALWVTQRKLARRERLWLDEREVVLEWRGLAVHRRLHFPRANLRGQVFCLGHPEDPLRVELYDRDGRHCSIGAFLNREEGERLVALLRELGVPLRVEREQVFESF